MVVNKYMSEIIRGNKDPRFIEYMSYEEDQRKRLNTMLRKSKEEGFMNANKENAYKMRDRGIDVKTIRDITGINFK